MCVIVNDQFCLLSILFHTGSFAQKLFSNWPNQSVYGFKKVANNNFLILKPKKGKLRFIFEIIKKIARWHHKSEISKRTVKTMISPLILLFWGCLGWQNNQYDPLLSPFFGFGLLFSSQNWINYENIPKSSNFLMGFDDFCRFFKCYSFMSDRSEQHRTKQTNYSSLTLSAFLDT